MEKIVFQVESRHSRARLDKFLVEVFNGRFSRSFIKKLIDSSNVKINDELKSANCKVSAGDRVGVQVPSPRPLELEGENIPLDIVYEDKDLLVVNKPAGITVHPAGPNLTGTLVNALLHCTKDLSGIGGVLRPGVVHRLDKETSGILVVAKNDAAHINLSSQFKNRTTKRGYIALVRGKVELDNGRIELPLARRKKEIHKMGVSFVDKKKKIAITNYKVLKRFQDFSLLELFLETGRTHQIRVHLAYIGHPVLGDKLYGSPKGLNRHALHAKTLGFFHPATKKFMQFDSPIPEDMARLIKKGRL